MAKTFQRTHGDIAAVLDTLFRSKEFDASLGAKFKDPMHYVIGNLRLAYDGKPIVNTHPVINWLNWKSPRELSFTVRKLTRLRMTSNPQRN